ncbi:MAG: hypothetical protein ABSF90_19730 [Syntrophobacteraceae bacterium]|jgi:hypothetical protein
MTRFCMTLLFSATSVAGAALVLYAILAGSRRNDESIGGECVAAGLFDSEGDPGGVLDLDMGHEGLKHREKEPFDPDKHRPEPIEARKKIS